MKWLYGIQISDEENAELLARLRRRGTIESLFAADTVCQPASRHATAETSVQAREAILHELQAWTDVYETAPGLASVREHLSKPDPTPLSQFVP
jgi:hypothetical protein